MINMCDGCQRNLPIKTSEFGFKYHYNPFREFDERLFYDTQACTKDKYEDNSTVF